MTSKIEPQVKRVLMALLKRGVIGVGQAAELGCVSRQAIQLWVDKAGWNLKQRQDAFAAREFARLMGQARPRSKRAMRDEAEAAKEAWDWRHDEDGLVEGPAAAH